MKRIFSFLLCLLLPAALTAQVAKSRPQLYVEIDTNLASGQSISAAQLRDTFKNVVASSSVPLSDGPDQPVDADLVAIAALNTFGVAERTNANTWTTNTWAQVWQKLLADPQAGTYTYTGLPFGITNDKRLLGRDSSLPPATAMEIAIGPGLQLSSGTLGLDAAGSATFGSINNTPIGNTVPSTGAFTTLTADSLTTASLSVAAINNTPIGNVTPSTGNFTNLTSTTFSSAISAGSINGTPIGNSTPSTGTFTNVQIKAAPDTNGLLYLNNAGLARWIAFTSGAEGGANAGSDYKILSFDDAGNGTGIPLSISRSTLRTTLTGLENTPIGATTPNTAVFSALAVKVSPGSVGGLVATFGSVGAPRIKLYDEDATYGAKIVSDAGSPFFISAGTVGSGAALALGDNGTEVVRISGANVGIGTPTPEAKLHVFTTINGSPSKAGYIYGSTDIGTFVSPDGTRTNATLTVGSHYGAEGAGVLNVFSSLADGLFFVGSNGNVGIGTTTPGAKLVVQGETWSYGTVRARSPGAVIDVALGDDGTGGIVGTSSNQYFGLWTNSAERMRIDTAGNVGIGTTTPGYKLDVSGSLHATSAVLDSISITSLNNTPVGNTTPSTGAFTNFSATGLSLFGAGAVADNVQSRVNALSINSAAGNLNARISTPWKLGTPTSSATLISFFGDNGSSQVTLGSISNTGSQTAFNTTSDRRLKTNIRDYKQSGKLIDKLKPRIFDWKEGGKDTVGFVAQELYEVFPAAVTKGDDNAKKIEEVWGVDYSKLVPVLVAEIQALRERVAVLEKKKP
jgi:hypothetical protein